MEGDIIAAMPGDAHCDSPQLPPPPLPSPHTPLLPPRPRSRPVPRPAPVVCSAACPRLTHRPLPLLCLSPCRRGSVEVVEASTERKI